MQYRENPLAARAGKEEYLAGLEKLIAHRQEAAKEIRREFTRDIFTDGQRYRRQFREMLGWPLTEPADLPPPAVEWEELGEEEHYRIFRVRIPVVDSLVLSGLFFRQKNGCHPLVIVQHGGSGTPERISGFYGTTHNYNDMVTRTLEYGVHVFAPQFLLWNQQEYGVPYDRIRMDSRLKRVGSSITAVEIYGIQRALDAFTALPEVGKVGMLGLSYGGFYTLFAAAADTRIQSAISCSYFCSRDEAPWSDWVWENCAHTFDDAEIACLCWPRRICLAMGSRDELFPLRASRQSMETIRDLCARAGIDTDWVELIGFDGVHEFYREDWPIARLVEDLR